MEYLTDRALSCRRGTPPPPPGRLPIPADYQKFGWASREPVSCSALLGGGRIYSGVGLATVTSAKKLVPATSTSSATPAR
jgi:hypothetical protein